MTQPLRDSVDTTFINVSMDSFTNQIATDITTIDASGCSKFSIKYVESDDLINSFVYQAEGKNISVYLM